MPTYAPVPSSFTTLSHRAQALFLYRHILREGAKFFDERASLWVRSRAQEAFRKNKYLSDENRVQKSISDARKALRLLERANQMDLKSVMRILRLSYGMLGRERQKLLKPFLDSTRARTLSPEKLSAAITQSASINVPEIPQDSSQSDTTTTLPSNANISKCQLSAALSQLKKDPQPLHYNNPRTIPPILSPPVVSLIKDASGKSPEPILPEPLFKPLHGKREANLRWRFFTKQINKVTPPLPTEIRQEMERKSRVGLKNNEADGNGGGGPLPSHITEGNWIEWEQRILNTIRAWNKNGKAQKEKSWETEIFHPSVGGKPARPNILTPRLYRRIWQRLLDEVPVLEVGVTTSKTDVKNDKTEEGGASSTLSSSLLLKPSFSITKSPLSYQARYSVGLKLHAKVNDFDQIGITEESVPPPSSKGRNKAPKTRP